MRYELLGPLRVANGQDHFTLSAPKMETLLALLLTSAGQSVTKDHLITELWGARPPRRAAAAVHVYISQLRKFLVSAGDSEGRAIVTTPAGYLLRRGGAELDVDDFQAINATLTEANFSLYDLTQMNYAPDRSLGWFYPVYLNRRRDDIRTRAFWDKTLDQQVIDMQAKRRQAILGQNAFTLSKYRAMKPPKDGSP